MAAKIQTAGDIIDAYCTSCRTVMNHTIVSMVQEHPARVQCNTCGGVHNYRKGKSASPTSRTTPKLPTTRQTRKDSGNAAHPEWVAMQRGQDTSTAIGYDMQSRYKVGNLVRHPKFGLGIVKSLVSPNKVEILFAEGSKLLRCG